jgi:hypothetical protein
MVARYGRYRPLSAITVSAQRKNWLLVRRFQTIFEFSHSLDSKPPFASIDSNAGPCPEADISRQRSERQRTLRLLFVAPGPGPVILINHEPVIQLGLDALEKMCRAP